MNSQATREKLDRRVVASIVALGVALRIVVLAWARGTMIDDAYITLRCSQNLLAGQGFVYNPGERVLATTAPLYGLIAAGAAAVTRGVDLGYVLGALNIAAFAASAALLADVANDFGRKATLLLLVVFACYVAFVDNSTIGMETPVFILGIASSLWLMRRGRFGWVSLVLGLLLLVRPEAVIWALALTAGAYVSGKRLRPIHVVPGLTVALAWIAISLPSYGSIIPHSVRSKCGWLVPFITRSLLPRGQHAFLSLALLDTPQTIGGAVVAGALLKVFILLSAVLFAIGAVSLLRRRKLASALPLLFLGYLAFYMIAKGRLDFSWYGIPSGLAYWATASVGLASIVRRLLPPHHGERLVRVALPLLAVVLVVASLWGWRVARLSYYRVMRSSYQAAGELIDATTAVDARILVDEAGMIGYAGKRHIMDLDGVVSPDVAALRRSIGWWCPICDIVRATEPDVIVLSWTHMRRLFREDGSAWVGANYDTLGTFPGHVALMKTQSQQASARDVQQ